MPSSDVVRRFEESRVGQVRGSGVLMGRRNAWARIAPLLGLALAVAGCPLGRVAFSPDGKRFAAVVQGDPEERADAAGPSAAGDPPSELWVTDASQGTHVRVARDPWVGVSPGWSVDGREVWFLHGPKLDSASLARWDGTAVTEVAPAPLVGDGQTFSIVPPQAAPDGRSFIVTEASEGHLSRIVRCNVADGAKTVLAESAGGGVLSPKGERLAFLAWEGASARPLQLCVMTFDGKPRRVIAKLRDKLNDVTGAPIAWSPDGAGLAWEDQPQETIAAADAHAVYVADVESLATTRISPVGETGRLPLFSHDGASVYYTRWITKDGPTIVRRADLAKRSVTDVPGSEGCVAAGISADGRYLAMQRSIGTKGAPGKDATVVRLVTLSTGEFRDDWVSAYQLRVWAATSVFDAANCVKDGRHDDSAAALVRADESLQLMARLFPGSEKHPAAARTRKEVDDLHAVK